MATVIDSLLINLGLDGSGFKAGANEVAKSQAKVGAATTAMGKDVEAATRGMIAGINRLKVEFLALFAVVSAGRTIKALTSDMIDADAATGRTAKNLGMATEELGTLGRAAERSGGSAAGVAISLGGIVSKLAQFKINGQGAEDLIGTFQRLGVSLRTVDGGWKSTTQLFTDLNTVAQGQPRDVMNQHLMNLGLDEGTRNLILSTQVEFNETLAKARQLGNPDKGWTDLAAKIEQRFSDMGQRLDTAWRGIISAAGPAILRVLDALGAWYDKYGASFVAGIGRALGDLLAMFTKWVDSLTADDWSKFWAEWKGFFNDAKEFGSSIMAALRAIHDWEPPAYLKALLGLSDHPFQMGGKPAEKTLSSRLLWDDPWTWFSGGSQKGKDQEKPKEKGDGKESWGDWGRRMFSGAGTASSGASASTNSADKAAFIAKWGPEAKRIAGGLDTSAENILAHWGQETGWGRHEHDNNVGNLQALPGTPGTVMRGDTHGDGSAYQAPFFAYQTPVEAADAYASWIKRHGAPVQGTAGNPEAYGAALRSKGYMENPDAPAAIGRAARGLNLSSASGLSASPVVAWLRDYKPNFDRIAAGAAMVASNVPVASAGFQAGNSTSTQTADNSVSNTAHIGAVHIHTPAKDGAGIARDFGKAVGGELGSFSSYYARNQLA